MKHFYTTSIALLTLIFASCNSQKFTYNTESVASPKGTAVYQDNWENIAANYSVPEWFKDAKFGIFIHWGPYSVPAFDNEWYARNMYQEGSAAYNHHRETWGPQDKFGYKDFIPLFKAEKFNANEWAELFKMAGAKYVVPVAYHHDGFAMYKSELEMWNSVDMGPKRDVVGELKKAILKQGMHFGVSSHSIENEWFFNGGMKFPSDVQDMSISLYGHRADNEKYTPEMAEDWLKLTYELIYRYQPELVWFDWTVNNPVVLPYFNKFMAHYYNCAIDWKKEVVVNAKQGYPTNVLVWDMERGKSDKLMQFPWQTDTSIGKRSWSHVENEENKTAQQIIHDLIDIVSKNGNLLLNVGPKADGTITDEQKAVLLDIGEWLKVNGDAIYGTRPWKKYGEGPTAGTKGTFTDHVATDYTAQDIRFTTKGNDFYAIMLNWGETVTITSLNPETIADAQLKEVSMLGCDENIKYEMTTSGIKIQLPKSKPCKSAYVVKLSFDKPVGNHIKSEASNEVMKHG